jgi:zinc/manganese transport system ATP-binding protein
VLQVRGLTVKRGHHIAVQNVSFDLYGGTDTAVVGPNGAGKSSLIQALLGILPHQAGEIRVLDHRLSPRGRLNPTVRQQVAYLPQNFAIDRQIPMTVAELVGLGWDCLSSWPFGYSPSKALSRSQAIDVALTKVQGEHLRSKPLSVLSGGEMKRALLAYCLVRPRRLLILDEAPAGLDRYSEGEFYERLQYLKHQEGWAILQVSHDLERVHRHCDQVIGLNQMIRCQGQPTHALTEENLSLTYGVYH